MSAISTLLLGFLAVNYVHTAMCVQNIAPAKSKSMEKPANLAGPANKRQTRPPITSSTEQESPISCTVMTVRYSVGRNTHVSKSECPEKALLD
jgi:hypothetical protein